MNDVSKEFVWNEYDAKVAQGLIEHEGTSEAVTYFERVKDGLSNYAYWFFLSTIWVSHSGSPSLNLWKELFSSKRSKRRTSIMKPSELKQYKKLPAVITVYRAHREGERDWISYTTDIEVAKRFAVAYGVKTINKYLIKKRDIIALFLRREESEIVLIDRDKAIFKESITVNQEGAE